MTNADSIPPSPPPPEPDTHAQDQSWMGIVALVTGLVGMGVIAIVFGALGLSAANRGRARNRGLSITGIVLGAVEVLAAVILTVIILSRGVGGLDTITVSGNASGEHLTAVAVTSETDPQTLCDALSSALPAGTFKGQKSVTDGILTEVLCGGPADGAQWVLSVADTATLERYYEANGACITTKADPVTIAGITGTESTKECPTQAGGQATHREVAVTSGTYTLTLWIQPGSGTPSPVAVMGDVLAALPHS